MKATFQNKFGLIAAERDTSSEDTAGFPAMLMSSSVFSNNSMEQL